MAHLLRSAGATLLIWALCGAAGAQAPSWRMHYRCDDGSRLAVSFDHESSPSTAWAGHAGRSAGLASTAEPSTYTDGHWTLRAQGNEATLDTAAGTHRCTGDGTVQRLVIDRETRLRFALPSSWLSQRYLVHLVRGTEAQVLYPGAELAVVVEYQPQAEPLRSHPLMQLFVLPAERWQAWQQQSKRAPLQVLGRQPGRVYAAALAQRPPYPAGSPDAQTFEVMRAALADPPQRLQQSFGWLGIDEGGRRVPLTGRLAWAKGIALQAGDELRVQLLDVSRPDAGAAVLAEQRMPASRKTVRFALPHDPGQIDPRGRYAVAARVLRDGRLLLASEVPQPVLTRGARAVPRLALSAARGVPAPADGGLVCRGREPDWSLRLWDTRASLRQPGRSTRTFGGGWQRIDHLLPRVAVWRGPPAPSSRAPLVAVLTQESCVDAMDEEGQAPSTHRAVVSMPDGQVMSGCCR